MMKKAIKIVTWIIIVALVAFVIAVLGVRLVGIKPYLVTSHSMGQAMPAGCMAYVVEDKNIGIGDIVTWSPSTDAQGNEMRITHRIVEINQDSQTARTKGDANDNIDPSPLSLNDIDGKVIFQIPYIGSIEQFLHTPTGIVVAIGFGIGVIILIFLPSIMEKIDLEEEKKKSKSVYNKVP